MLTDTAATSQAKSLHALLLDSLAFFLKLFCSSQHLSLVIGDFFTPFVSCLQLQGNKAKETSLCCDLCSLRVIRQGDYFSIFCLLFFVTITSKLFAGQEPVVSRKNVFQQSNLISKTCFRPRVGTTLTG